MFFCFFFLVKYRIIIFFFFFSSRRRHTRSLRDWSSDVCSSDLLITLISRCKDEDISPEEYQAHAGRLEREAAAAVDYEEAHERASQQRELAATYAKYEELMTRDGCVDFGDQIVQVLRLLRRRPYVLGAYQRRFRYILVDE